MEQSIKEQPPLTDYRLWLHSLFEERRKRNPNISMRAFARRIGLSPTSLCHILCGKRKLSLKSAMKVAANLELPQDEYMSLIAAVTQEQRPGLEMISTRKFDPIGIDQFRLIADWYHFAILALFETTNSSTSVEDIVRRLRIDRATAKAALDRLERLDLLKRNGEHFKFTPRNVATPTDVPDATIRMHHRQMLLKAEESLEGTPVDRRDFSTMTLAIDPEVLPEAKKKIMRFRRELTKFLEKGKKKKVYAISVQLFPLELEVGS